MRIRHVVAIGTLTSALTVALPFQAAAQSPQGSQPSTQREMPSGQPGTTATGGQNDAGTFNRDTAAQNQAELPNTASPLPLIALGGLAALGGAAALRRRRG